MVAGTAHAGVRRACLGAVLVLALVAAAGGVAWACGPSGGFSLSADSGPPGREAVVTGTSYPSSKVELRWDAPDGPLLASTTTSVQGGFSAPFTIPEATPGVHYLIAMTTDSQGNHLTVTSGPVEVLEPPTLTVSPTSGRASSRIQVEGSSFTAGPVRLHWDGEEGPLLGTVDGPAFSLSFAIPAGTHGRHRILATGRDGDGRLYGRATALFDVTQAGEPVPLPDTVGPAIASAALSLANRNRTVSRTGYVTLFCGSFQEAGVTGRCGATSVRGLRAGPRPSSRRRLRLTLRGRPFTALKGEPVRMRFRISRRGMAALGRARKVPMRGNVTSRDAAGNATNATFRFTLKGPRRPGTRRSATTPGL